MKREIQKNPEMPFLSDEVTGLLTALCFRPDDPIENSDLIFQFSTADELRKVADMIEGLLALRISSKVFVTGGVPGYEGATKINESRAVLDLIDKHKYPDVTFFSEDVSTNTLNNVTEALKVLDFTRFQTVLFIYKSHAARRGYLTLKRFLPDSKLIQKTYNTTYQEVGKMMNKDNWHTFDFGKSRVWGEYLRIKKYSEKGDIFLDQETEGIIRQIEMLLS